MMGVICQSFVSNLGEAELSLHYTEDVLNLGANFGLTAIFRSLFFAKPPVPVSLLLGRASQKAYRFRTVRNHMRSFYHYMVVLPLPELSLHSCNES